MDVILARDLTREPGIPRAKHAAKTALSPHHDGGWTGEYSTCLVVDDGTGGINQGCVITRAGVVGCAKLVRQPVSGAPSKSIVGWAVGVYLPPCSQRLMSGKRNAPTAVLGLSEVLCSPQQVAEGRSETILWKETATKSLGDRILGGTILPGLSVPQGKPTTMMAMLMVQRRAPCVGAMSSLEGREGIDLLEDDASCNRLTSF